MRKVLAVALCAAVVLLGMPGNLLAASKTATVQPPQKPQTGQVKVTLKDAKGQPVANATVNITNAAGDIVGTATTDAAGEAVLTLPVGTFNVSIVSGGVVVGTGSITVAAGALGTLAVTVGTSVGAVIGGGAAGGLFGLGALGTVGVIGGAGLLGYFGYKAAKNPASPSR